MKNEIKAICRQGINMKYTMPMKSGRNCKANKSEQNTLQKRIFLFKSKIFFLANGDTFSFIPILNRYSEY